jgi:hypothetical protein
MKFVPEGVTRAVARQSLNLSKNSPHILFGVGVVGVIGTTVLASQATLKLTDVLNEIDKDVAVAEHIAATRPDDYSQKDLESDLQTIRIQGILKVGKLYAPAVVVGVASIAALTKSHSILTNRNTAITAAYVALDKGFSQYRARVVDELGEGKDHEFRYGTETHKLKNPETGKKETFKTVSEEANSIYAVFFDHENRNWTGNMEYNTLFLKCQQNWANDMLRSRGHLMLNDVYDALGFPRTTPGSVVGWVWNPNDDSRDNYVDFGCLNEDQADNWIFINGESLAILLDFNVDGPVFELIDEIEKEKRHDR